MLDNQVIISSVLLTIEFLGTFAFAISGIRKAIWHQYDWFGCLVCGIAVAIGGGTIRDLLLGVTPFWMTSPLYLIAAVLAQLFVFLSARILRRLNWAWLLFDTLGLGLFTIAGVQKTLACGHPYWVAVIMGCITGSAGGVLSDVLLNREPTLFRKEIYATACIIGGCIYCLMEQSACPVTVNCVITFLCICLIRLIAIRYHLSMPRLVPRHLKHAVRKSVRVRSPSGRPSADQGATTTQKS
ncbi:MAG: trimeric intracellular cation channel family protein [Succinivibrio sp.]|nr:trimeric intracellular cation channel family protein [Succinivibrio sp.]